MVLKRIEEIGKTQVEVSELRKQELIKGTQQVKDLIAAGELTKAKELSDKLEQLAFERIEKTRQAEAKAAELNKNLPQQRAGLFGDDEQIQQYTSLIGSSSEALRQYNEIAKLGDQALKGLADTQTKQADDAQAQADKQTQALRNVRDMIADIDNAIKTSSTLKINVDDSAARAAIEELKKPTESTHTVNVVERQGRANGGLIKQFSSGGKVAGPGTGTSDSIPAMLSNGEYVIKADSVNRLGVGTLDYINKLGQLPTFAGGGLVAYQSSFSTQAQQKTGDTFVLNIPFGDKVLTTTGVKTAENINVLNQLAELMSKQARSMS